MARPITAPIFNIIDSLRNSNFTLEIVDKNEYTNSKTPISVRCKQCGHTQESRPDNLIQYIKNNTPGCHQCAEKSRRKNRILSIDTIKERIKRVHNDKYQYPYLTDEYKNSSSIITIICSHHGEFKQSITSHTVQKYGCQKCGYNSTRLSLEQILKDFRTKHHDYYDYSKVTYDETMNVQSKVIIICPTHGEFEQAVMSHKAGKGCSSCASSNGGVSFKALSWLDHIAELESIEIQHAANVGEYNIPGTKYRVDGFCKETNTVYEFHGDLFHGNIKRFDASIKNNPFRKETVGELYQLTIEREEEIRNLGYNLVTIWESDFDTLDIPVKRYDIQTFRRTGRLDDLPLLMIDLLDDEFISTEHKHRWKCKICNKEFKRNLNKARIAYRETGRIGCSVECSNKFKGKSKTPSEDRLFKLWDEANAKGFNIFRTNGNEYRGMNGKLEVECKGCNSNLLLRPVSIERAILNRKSGCRSSSCFGVSW